MAPFKIVSTKNAPAAVGPYSQAIRAGDFIFCSGQIPIEPASGELKLFGGDAAQQTKVVISNLKAVLESEGLSLGNVVKTTVYLQNMNDFSKVNEVYAASFGDHKPARACVEVARLPKGVSVEIDAIALICPAFSTPSPSLSP